MSLAWHDGKFVAKSSLSVSPADLGLSRGVAVFELARAYGGVAFRLDDHLERLEHGARQFGIQNPFSREEMTQAIARLRAENRFAHSAVKFYLTAGECAHFSGTSFADCDGFTPHLMIMEDEIRPDHPEAPYGLERYRRGQRLKSIPCNREFPTVKSANYALAWVAARTQVGKEWDDILFTRPGGYVAEASRSNFFCVIDNTLCTPKEGILFGVTRKVLLELAARHGIAVAERDFTVSDLARASEAFTTGSISEMVPVRQVDDYAMPTVMNGPIFKKLRQAFTDTIAEFCHKAKAA